MYSKIAVAAALIGAASAAPYMAASSSSSAAPYYTTSAAAPYLTSSSASSSSSTTTSASSSSATSTTSAADLLLAVNEQATNIGKFNVLLTENGLGKTLLSGSDLSSRLVFDFNSAPPAGDGGRITTATESNFPILNGQGISGAVAFLNPCGMNSPHTHPRATELLTLVEGKLQTGFMLENNFVKPASSGDNSKKGALTTQVSAELSPFQSTVFPKGSIHFQFNPSCEPATFVAALSSEDPGTSQIAQNFFFLNETIVDAVLTENGGTVIDGSNIEMFRSTLPANLVLAHENCMAACKK